MLLPPAQIKRNIRPRSMTMMQAVAVRVPANSRALARRRQRASEEATGAQGSSWANLKRALRPCAKHHFKNHVFQNALCFCRSLEDRDKKAVPACHHCSACARLFLRRPCMPPAGRTCRPGQSPCRGTPCPRPLREFMLHHDEIGIPLSTQRQGGSTSTFLKDCGRGLASPGPTAKFRSNQVCPAASAASSALAPV